MIFVGTYRYFPVGEPPSPRATHTATAVGTMVVIQVEALMEGSHYTSRLNKSGKLRMLSQFCYSIKIFNSSIF
jgi:hypothetical protein